MTREHKLESQRAARWLACDWRRALAAILCSLTCSLGTGVAGATGADDDESEPSDGRTCSASVNLLFRACGHETRDDYLVAQAKCLHLADPFKRSECKGQARAARREATRHCRALKDWRSAGCGVLGEGRYDPPFTPDLFDSDFRQLSNPNPYFPLGIGHRWEFRGGDEHNILEVTNETKNVEGVTCIVLRDLVYESGALKEATDDWYAAGRDGSTWYCGEEVKDYASFDGDRPQRPELVSRDGSFKHGVNGDKAGLIMPARPRAGQWYLEEFSLGNAEDVSEVVSVTYSYGNSAQLDQLVPRELALRLCNRDCVVTRNYSLLEPGIYAVKYYARGIGFFLETKPLAGQRLQLVACSFDTRCVALPGP